MSHRLSNGFAKVGYLLLLFDSVLGPFSFFFGLTKTVRILKIHVSFPIPLFEVFEKIIMNQCCQLLSKFSGQNGPKNSSPFVKIASLNLCRLHTAFLHWPLSSAATKKVQGPDTT